MAAAGLELVNAPKIPPGTPGELPSPDDVSPGVVFVALELVGAPSLENCQYATKTDP